MEKNLTVGTICAFLSAFFFGSAYVPLKWFHKGDGMYFQWVQSVGQLLVGVIVSLTIDPAPLNPIGLLGGAFYSIGNSLTVFIMEGTGLAVGYLLWNTVSCVVGWAVTRFGLFGNPQQLPKSNWLNIMGVIVICVGGAIYAPIKHIPTKVRPAPWSIEEKKKEDKEVSHSRRVLCICLTIFVGFLYGNLMTPMNYVMAHEPGAPQDVRAFNLSYCVGAFVTSTVIFFFYCIVKKNVPLVNPELSLPSLLSGLCYGIAVPTFFIANQHIDQVIAYPIVTKAPGLIVSLWSIFLFKEIKGRRNIIQLYIGIGVTLVGIALISLSKIEL